MVLEEVPTAGALEAMLMSGWAGSAGWDCTIMVCIASAKHMLLLLRLWAVNTLLSPVLCGTYRLSSR